MTKFVLCESGINRKNSSLIVVQIVTMKYNLNLDLAMDFFKK